MAECYAIEALSFMGRISEAMDLIQSGIHLVSSSSLVFDLSNSKSAKNEALTVPVDIISALNKLVVQTIMRSSMATKKGSAQGGDAGTGGELLIKEAYRIHFAFPSLLPASRCLIYILLKEGKNKEALDFINKRSE